MSTQRTRRRFLAGAGLALGAGLAGCTRSGVAGSANTSNTTTATPSSSGDLGLGTFVAEVDGQLPIESGETWHIHVPKDAFYLFDRDSGEAIHHRRL